MVRGSELVEIWFQMDQKTKKITKKIGARRLSTIAHSSMHINDKLSFTYPQEILKRHACLLPFGEFLGVNAGILTNDQKLTALANDVGFSAKK